MAQLHEIPFQRRLNSKGNSLQHIGYKRGSLEVEQGSKEESHRLIPAGTNGVRWEGTGGEAMLSFPRGS